MQNEGPQNIIRFGKTQAGRQRFKCKSCGHTFTETKGTIFYRRRTPEAEIIETLAFVAEGSRISSLVRVKGHKEETILAWVREAAEQAEAIEEVLRAKYQLDSPPIGCCWEINPIFEPQRTQRSQRNP